MKFLIDFEMDETYNSEEEKRDAYIEYIEDLLSSSGTSFSILEDETMWKIPEKKANSKWSSTESPYDLRAVAAKLKQMKK